MSITTVANYGETDIKMESLFYCSKGQINAWQTVFHTANELLIYGLFTWETSQNIYLNFEISTNKYISEHFFLENEK